MRSTKCRIPKRATAERVLNANSERMGKTSRRSSTGGFLGVQLLSKKKHRPGDHVCARGTHTLTRRTQGSAHREKQRPGRKKNASPQGSQPREKKIREHASEEKKRPERTADGCDRLGSASKRGKRDSIQKRERAGEHIRARVYTLQPNERKAKHIAKNSDRVVRRHRRRSARNRAKNSRAHASKEKRRFERTADGCDRLGSALTGERR